MHSHRLGVTLAGHSCEHKLQVLADYNKYKIDTIAECVRPASDVERVYVSPGWLLSGVHKSPERRRSGITLLTFSFPVPQVNSILKHLVRRLVRLFVSVGLR